MKTNLYPFKGISTGLKVLVVIFIQISIFSGFISAQSISGRIKEKDSDYPLNGASLTLKGENKTYTTLANLDGTYRFNNLPSGTYELRISSLGYQNSDVYKIQLESGKNIVKNVYLQSSITALTEVNVNGGSNREGEGASLNKERFSLNVMNSVSAKAIAISPDVTVANVMQRVSGVSIEKNNNGEGQFVTIRGMDKRYNTTLINGIKIPSPDNRNRYVPLDIFPAELVERIDVYKSLTPSLEGDASGGVVNMIMKSAPDKFKIEGNFGTGYNQLFFNRGFNSFNTSTVNAKSPGEFLPPGGYANIKSFPYQNLVTTDGPAPINFNGNLVVGRRFLNDKLGFIVAGSYQRQYTGNNTFVLLQNATVGPAHGRDSSQNQTFPESYNRSYNSKVSRLGLISTIDFRFNKNNSISLFGTYLQLNERRVRLNDDYTLGNYSYNGYVGPFYFDKLVETRSTLQNIYDLILSGRDKISSRFALDYSIALSQAKQALPDRAEFDVSRLVSPVQSSIVNGVASAIVYDTAATSPEKRSWLRNTDKDISGFLNLYYNWKKGDNSYLIKIGGMARHKTRDDYANDYTLTPFADPGFVYQKYTSIPTSTFFFQPSSDAAGNSLSNAGVYNFTEDVEGGYLEIKYEFQRKFNVLFGARVENTSQSFVNSLPVTIAGKTGQINYLDILPSANLKYSLNEKSALRLSYFHSIFRPSFSDLIPYQDNSGFYSDNYPITGNPFLQHTQVENFDVRYEFYPQGLDEFMVGAFYKLLKNPIEYGFIQPDFSAQIVIEPQNFGTAHNYGVEVVFRKFFGDLGISGNYTYTKSLITTQKRFEFIDQVTNGDSAVYVNQSRPLQGQSDHVGNFSLLYKNSKNLIDAQLALVYTGPRIAYLSIYKDLDTWEKGTLNLDFSAQKEFKKHFTVFVKINNILNTPYELFIKQPNKAYVGVFKLPHQESPNYKTVEYDQFFARYSLGFRFKF